MGNNTNTLVRLINEYHQKVEEYKAIEEDYKRLKTLENKIETVTVQKTIPSEDVVDEYKTEYVWRSIVAEMGSNIAQILGEGNGLHVQQELVANHFGGADIRMTTQFKFIKTMGPSKKY